VPFRWGRIDEANCTYENDRLPKAERGFNHVMEWAVDQLGFTQRETVALMGAHTLGRAVPANSGYDGATPAPCRLGRTHAVKWALRCNGPPTSEE